MGTPQFSVLPLLKLLEAKHNIIGVYTRRPKPANRGQKLETSPVYKIAKKNNLKNFYTFKFKKRTISRRVESFKS